VPWKPLGHALNAPGGVGAEVSCPSTTPRFFSAGGQQFFLGETERFKVVSAPIFLFKTSIN